jgi:uncharacterized protein YdeI (BOF family)
MKKIIFVISAVLFSTYSFSQRVSELESDKTTQKVEKEAPKTQTQTETKVVDATIDFESKVVDYGTIEHNADGARKFVFTNNGTEPLIIKNAKGSCGCTVPTWPREPIAAGETAEIGVKYATNRVGKFTKTITLTTNASKKPVILTVKGEVNPAPKEASAPERKTEGSPLEKK